MKNLISILLIFLLGTFIADANAFVVRGGGAVKVTNGAAIKLDSVDLYIKESSMFLLKDSTAVVQKKSDVINKATFVLTDNSLLKTRDNMINAGSVLNKSLIFIGCDP